MSRYNPPPRDRSPQRQFDRRSSSTYTPNPASSSSYRPSNEPSQVSVDRPPPRGPRADSFRGGNFSFNSAPRGRGTGFGGPRAGDTWDRERERERERDIRNPPVGFRRDDDRSDWPRRDDRPAFSRDRPYVGRDRSASPARPRRDSKENVVPTFNRPQDNGPGYFQGNARGAPDRGRGRGGWDRSRGRSSFIGDRERDLFPTRSRSREGWRDREVDRTRNFGPEVDRNDRFERRDYDRLFEREPRGRDHDIWQRDVSPGRSSTGNRAPSPGALSSISQERGHKAEYDIARKPLPSSSILQARDARRDADNDYFGARNDGPRREPSFPQPLPIQSVPQSSAIGLDYGPPPSAPVTMPAAGQIERTPQSVKTSKQDAQHSSSTPFQPPSGPKADRSSSTNTGAQLVQQSDVRAKPETIFRQERAQNPETPNRPISESSRPGNEANNDRTSSTNVPFDRPLPPNVPSGPRMGSGPYKPRTSPIVQQTALTPVQPKSVSTDVRNIPNAPTGPRSASILPPSGPRASMPTGPATAQGGPSSLPWGRRAQIEYRPPKPSIMNNMNRPHMIDRPLPMAMQINPKQSPRPNMAQLADVEKKVFKPVSPQASVAHLNIREETTTLADIEMSAPGSEDEDADDEPDSELDENYFADSEKIHAREMELLKARKPPPLLGDPVVVNLLIRIQLLGMIVNDLVPDEIHAIRKETDVEMLDQPAGTLVSPEETPQESRSPQIEHPMPRGRPLKEPLVNPIPTPPIEELPYLKTKPNTVLLWEDPVEDEVEEEKISIMLRNLFEHQTWEEKGDLEELYEFYRQKFPEWKYEIDRYERMRRELEATPDPGSPGGQSSTSIPPSIERLTGRAARNATEFDMEKAILMSQQSAREEEERREREAASNSKPNYETEAVVPDMLKPSERDVAWRFQDTNSIVPAHLAVELMEYIPPEDDFTGEEQIKFIAAFCQTPKKWGLIADQIPSRSYQECIAHYYLTKNEAHYKELWRRSQPKRKRGRAANKPRSTALLSDMALNEDPDSTPAPVTDSGRPRRAAAPTFGDVPDAEAAAIPAAKRLAIAPKELSENGALKSTKRKAGTATKVRRTKAQLLADKQAELASQINPDGSPIKGGVGRTRAIVAAKTDSTTSASVLRPTDIELPQMTNMGLPLTTAPIRQRSPPPPPVVTSYWSVPEQQKFRQLVAYYGRDYARIADFMKTKSQAMIKNHYSREIQKGDVELERQAQAAEDRVARGEPLGRLPSPIIPPKRKYDAIPPALGQGRPLTANAEIAAEIDRTALPVKASVVEDFPANAVHRDASGSMVAKPSPRTELLQQHSPRHPPVQTKVEDLSRDRPFLTPKGLQGPQRGLFTHDDNVFSLNTQQRQQHLGNDHVLHHHPPQLVDLRGVEVPAHARDIFSQSHEPVVQNQPTSQLPQYRGYDPTRIGSSRQVHSRQASMEQRAAEIKAHQNERNRMHIISTTQSIQSPQSQPMQASVAPRPEAFPAFAPVHQQQQQQPPPPQSQPHQPPVVKQEPLKPAPAKRSNVFGLLNDDPPERPVKRSSTDSAHRGSIQTPPPQLIAPSAQQPYQPRMLEDASNRPTIYGGISQPPNYRHVSDLRSTYSNSPAPSHRSEAWIDKFDPRQPTTDRTSNQSPSYSVVPPAPLSTSKSGMQGMGDGHRSLEPNVSRRNEFGRPQISSPPKQASTPIPHYRPASAAPQHSRMTSLGYSHNVALGADHRPGQQMQPQTHSQQQPHLQPSVSHAPPVSGTSVQPIHHRGGQQSIDLGHSRRLTIQEYKAQTTIDQPRDPRDTPEQRHHREDLLQRGTNEPQQRSIAPPPQSSMQEPPRQMTDHRDLYRAEPVSHQVPPPPSRTSQFNPPYGPPPQRTFTPPMQYGNDPRDPRDPRSIAAAHNQTAHHHHHSISAPQQQPSQDPRDHRQGPPSSMHHHHHHNHSHQQHPQPQPQPGLTSQSHQGIAPHTHQSQQPTSGIHSHQHQHQQGLPQYRQDQGRYGGSQQQGPVPGPGPNHGMVPPPNHNHYRQYSQGGDQRS